MNLKKTDVYSVLLVVSFLLLIPSISGQSIWIDEATTAFYARQDGVGDLFRALAAEEGSEVQMPLGVLSAYLFGKILGTSEYALRLPNLLWLGISLLALTALGRRYQMPWLPLLFALHPMVWFYADEARPYALQFACASVLLWSATRLIYESPLKTRTLCWFWGAGVALCASSLLAAIIFSVWMLIVFFGYSQWRYLMRVHVKISLASVGVLAMLSVYYLWTVLRGAGGAKLWSLGWANPAFALFEFGGFMGFSPGRVALREAGRAGGSAIASALQPYMMAIVLLAFIYVVLLFLSRRVWKDAIPRFCLIWSISAVAALVAICLAVGFPFWGRHLAPLFPVVILALGFCIKALPSSVRVLIAGVLLMMYAGSALNQRFNENHRKDDYRSAVAFAKGEERDGASVLWVANHLAARYYGYTPNVIQPDTTPAQLAAEYDLVIISKPDIFDPDRRVSELLRDDVYSIVQQFQAFTIYAKERPDGA